MTNVLQVVVLLNGVVVRIVVEVVKIVAEVNTVCKVVKSVLDKLVLVCEDVVKPDEVGIKLVVLFDTSLVLFNVV